MLIIFSTIFITRMKKIRRTSSTIEESLNQLPLSLIHVPCVDLSRNETILLLVKFYFVLDLLIVFSKS